MKLPRNACRPAIMESRGVVASLLPLLRLSDHPIIVNVSSSIGKLKNKRSERIRGIFDDIENLTEEKLDNVLDEFLKAALNTYVRILAERCPNVLSQQCVTWLCQNRHKLQHWSYRCGGWGGQRCEIGLA
uniref:Uncharacterized protein n=1 Tax=Kalanchoe fedtschenkoi TaxID=63787 RepID=A0A7N0UXU6_KALFE